MPYTTQNTPEHRAKVPQGIATSRSDRPLAPKPLTPQHMHEPILIADSTRGIYAAPHAARTLKTLCEKQGWVCTDMEAVTYATQGPDEALETFTDIERATVTDPNGTQYAVEEHEGGDIFLIPNA